MSRTKSSALIYLILVNNAHSQLINNNKLFNKHCIKYDYNLCIEFCCQNIKTLVYDNIYLFISR